MKYTIIRTYEIPQWWCDKLNAEFTQDEDYEPITTKEEWKEYLDNWDEQELRDEWFDTEIYEEVTIIT
jgi:hypothetical protein